MYRQALTDYVQMYVHRDVKTLCTFRLFLATFQVKETHPERLNRSHVNPL